MKFTLSWLKDHLNTSASLTQITDTLTMIGLEVEQVTDRAAALKPFTVAKILHAEPHPQADKLRVCRVESDIGELQIVCGAPNARAGIYVALAKEGAVIPANGMVIKKTKIRGVESNGMLCSAEELALGGESEGIIELPPTKIGDSIVNVLGLDDSVIEIAITPNRADALGVRGIAHDLAAAGLGTLKPLTIPSTKHQAPSTISITITDPNCPQFIGCHIKNVKNVESPEWLKKRLEAVGQKSISALVDITNYMTIDLNRPLHVFDARKLRGNLTVRPAKEGEKLKALNGKEYTLSQGMTVIADDSGVLSLGGIIGGEATGCTEDTTEVFLEVALFDPAHIAKTGRQLAIDSDARYRFERGVDPAFVETGAKIAIQMIQELCGGEASVLVHAGKTPNWQRSITFSPERVKALGGVDVSARECNRILTALGFTMNGTVTPPSWRGDVEGEADLVEEILRIHGYNHIPNTLLPASTGTPAQPISQIRAQEARRILASRGMLEACTWSFLPEAQAKLFGGGNPKLKLVNPISADLDTMRPSLLPNLLAAAKKNVYRNEKTVSLFEIGLEFHDITSDGQRMAAAGIRAIGLPMARHYVDNKPYEWSLKTPDAFDAKGDTLAILQALGISKSDVTANAPSWYHPGRSGVFMLGKTILGYFGELHPSIAEEFGLGGEHIAAFEIFLDAFPSPRAKGKAKPPLKLSDYQAVERDFAFIVDDKITAAEITKALAQADKQLITDIALFDVYAGKGVEPGKKSVAIRVTLQAMDRTLSEQEITPVSQAIVAAAAKEFGGQLRQ